MKQTLLLYKKYTHTFKIFENGRLLNVEDHWILNIGDLFNKYTAICLIFEVNKKPISLYKDKHMTTSYFTQVKFKRERT